MPARVDYNQPDEDRNKPILTKLGQAQFDPVDFLNESLPSLSLSPQSQKAGRSTQVQSVATESLALLSSLNTINIRSSTELTSLTDEIIRGGNRLAYEVEVLRGDVNGFYDLLTETLREDIAHFVAVEVINAEPTAGIDRDEVAKAPAPSDGPEFMSRVRSLGKVRARLESVITVFGEAMKWPVPPSEVSGAALISVSAPELGIQSTEEDEKAREVLMQIRTEIIDLLGADFAVYTGVDAASQRVQDYRQLALLWKSTSEEKARLKFVESLAKLVEDRRKALDAREAARTNRSDGPAYSNSAMGRIQKGVNETGGAVGLFRNLQRLKDDLYLE